MRWQDAILGSGPELDADALRERAAHALVEAIPVLRTDSDLLDAARASTAANLDLVFAIARGSVAAAELEPPPQAIAFTRALARRGVPVTELERGYRAVQHALWRWAVGVLRARITDPVALAREIERFSDATFATGDLLSAVVMERYAQERERWVRSADAVRAAAVEELLSGRPVDVAAMSRRIRYELLQEHQAFVAWSESEGTVAETAAAALGGPRALLIARGVDLIAGWAPAGTLVLDASVGPGTAVAVGLPAAGAEGFRVSHEQAMEARRVARMCRFAPRRVCYEDVARLALLTRDEEHARQFAARVLGPLADDDPRARTLARTLFVVLEEQGSPRRAGRRLGVHENTVAKRLRAIDALLDPGGRAGPADLLAALTIQLAGQDAQRVDYAATAALSV